jgi:hypothetical protein
MGLATWGFSVHIEVATLLAADGVGRREIDAELILATLWSMVLPEDGVEHIRVRCTGDRIGIVIFQAEECVPVVPDIGVELIRRAKFVWSSPTAW